MGNLVSIQYLRAIAALLVAADHLEAPLRRLGYEGWFPQFPNVGVDIFFVISGVVMWLSTSERTTTPREFWARRLIRIVPMYWLVTALTVAVMLVIPWAVNNGRFDLAHATASFLFVPWPHPTLVGEIFPVLIPGWTINAEMFFYAVFGLALILPERSRIGAVAGLFVALIVVGLLLQPLGPLSFYTRPLLLEFVAGLLLGRLILTNVQVRGAYAIGLIAAGVAVLALSQLFEGQMLALDRTLYWGIPAVLIVAGAVYAERAGPLGNLPALEFLGDASYSIYLLHSIALSAVSAVWARLPIEGAAAQLSYIPTALAAVVAVGATSYVILERPMTQALLAWFKRRRATTLAPRAS